MHKCSVCNKEKPRSIEFYRKCVKRVDGLRAECRECERVRARGNYSKSIETKRHSAKLRQKRFKYANPEKCKKWNKKRVTLMAEQSDGTISGAEITTLLDMYDNCPYCGEELTENNTQLDHMHPVSLGGVHGIDNLIPCCGTCNRAKGYKPFDEWLTLIPEHYANELIEQVAI